jgi:hypothetical protein
MAVQRKDAMRILMPLTRFVLLLIIFEIFVSTDLSYFFKNSSHFFQLCEAAGQLIQNLYVFFIIPGTSMINVISFYKIPVEFPNLLLDSPQPITPLYPMVRAGTAEERKFADVASVFYHQSRLEGRSPEFLRAFMKIFFKKFPDRAPRPFTAAEKEEAKLCKEAGIPFINTNIRRDPAFTYVGVSTIHMPSVILY